MGSPTKHTEQAIQNWSFDETYQQAAVEILTENAGGTALKRQKTIATEETLQDSLSTYQLANIDVAGDPLYLGYLDKNGLWYLKKISISAGTVEYCKGDSGYNWAGRVGAAYGAFNSIF